MPNQKCRTAALVLAVAFMGCDKKDDATNPDASTDEDSGTVQSGGQTETQQGSTTAGTDGTTTGANAGTGGSTAGGTGTAGGAGAASSSSQPYQAPIGPVYGLKVTSADSVITNNSCNAFTVTATALNGMDVRADADTALLMKDDTTAPYTGAFYSDSACATPLPSDATMIAKEASTTTVYYRTAYPDVTAHVSATGTGITTVTEWSGMVIMHDVDQLSLNTDDVASGINMDGTFVANQCIGPFTLETFDELMQPLILTTQGALQEPITYQAGDARVYLVNTCDTPGPNDFVSNIWPLRSAYAESDQIWIKGSTDSTIVFGIQGSATTQTLQIDYP